MQPGIFRRKIIGPVIHISNPSKPSDDSVPPSKIGDLKIRQVPGASTPDRLLAEWTAPGGDFDVGSVASYRFVFSSNIEDLIKRLPLLYKKNLLICSNRDHPQIGAKFKEF